MSAVIVFIIILFILLVYRVRLFVVGGNAFVPPPPRAPGNYLRLLFF